jgi:hypothetical protein
VKKKYLEFLDLDKELKEIYNENNFPNLNLKYPELKKTQMK